MLRYVLNSSIATSPSSIYNYYTVVAMVTHTHTPCNSAKDKGQNILIMRTRDLGKMGYCGQCARECCPPIKWRRLLSLRIQTPPLVRTTYTLIRRRHWSHRYLHAITRLTGRSRRQRSTVVAALSLQRRQGVVKTLLRQILCEYGRYTVISNRFVLRQPTVCRVLCSV